MSDDRVQQVIDELDPTPASEAAWPVSRRQTLRALAAAGLVGAGSGSASAESAGGVIADEAVLSNYGSESVSDGWELTIDDDVFALTESDTETIGLPDGAVGEELVTPSGGEASEIVAPDGTRVFNSFDVPDSEADQKLVHRWPLYDVNGSVEDTIGDADGTNNGVESVSGAWAGGSAGDGDGVDDHIETTTLGDFGSNMDTDCAMAFSIQTTDGDSSVLGVTADGDNNMRFEANLLSGFGSAEGELAFVIGSDGSSEDWSGIYTTNRIDDGEPRRVVCNKTGNTRSDLEIWIDGEEATTGDGGDDFNPNDVVNFLYPFLLFARNEGGVDSPMDGVLDDICIFGDSLTETEIQSYNNPWE